MNIEPISDQDRLQIMSNQVLKKPKHVIHILSIAAQLDEGEPGNELVKKLSQSLIKSIP